jgi:hypothetical protein
MKILGRREMRTGCSRENLKEKGGIEGVSV